MTRDSKSRLPSAKDASAVSAEMDSSPAGGQLISPVAVTKLLIDGHGISPVVVVVAAGSSHGFAEAAVW